jgi:hypothetical protein
LALVALVGQMQQQLALAVRILFSALSLRQVVVVVVQVIKTIQADQG